MAEPEADPCQKQETACHNARKIIKEGRLCRATGQMAEQFQIKGKMERHHTQNRQTARKIKGRDAAGRVALICHCFLRPFPEHPA
jgi:hypothetical protein